MVTVSYVPTGLPAAYVLAGVKEVTYWHLHEKIDSGVRSAGCCNGKLAESFCPAAYSKKDAEFTVPRTFTASTSGILVKNSMGLPVAREASAQEYAKKFFMLAE